MGKDPIMDMYIFESNQLTEQLEGILLESEAESNISEENVSEIFRIMHTLKGSSAMMMYGDISNVAHKIEDLFFYIREGGRDNVDFIRVIDLSLDALDFIRGEVEKVESEEEELLESGEEVVKRINSYLAELKDGEKKEGDRIESEKKNVSKGEQEAESSKDEGEEEGEADEEIDYYAKVEFQEGCQMENIRAFTVLENVKPISTKLYHEPDELLDNGEEASQTIIKDGFKVYFSSRLGYQKIKELLDNSLFTSKTELEIIPKEHIEKKEEKLTPRHSTATKKANKPNKNKSQGIINVDVSKLDRLLDLVGEIVTTESMLVNTPEIREMEIESFNRSSRQLKKLTGELQDIAMSLRMVPIGPVFQKMNRIVRDMSKKVNKEVELVTSGEDTEVDKNIIDHLADPFMHLIRNSMDHGIEDPEERERIGKEKRGTIFLRASNTGGDIIINISDDGKGLDREVLIAKAREKGLTDKTSEEISDSEAYALILEPGFSTKENVTEFSGRGVGMDVVRKNIEKIGGKISIDSSPGRGTSIFIKIPLTLAIIDGMQISTGGSMYTIPVNTIRQSFRPKKEDIIRDTSDNEMIMVRGNCYPIIKMYEHFGIEPEIRDLTEGILIMVEGENRKACIFADELIGEQQVVVKPIPPYLDKYKLKELGVGGCNILGDGSISLIINTEAMIDRGV